MTGVAVLTGLACFIGLLALGSSELAYRKIYPNAWIRYIITCIIGVALAVTLFALALGRGAWPAFEVLAIELPAVSWVYGTAKLLSQVRLRNSTKIASRQEDGPGR